jgi:transposase
LRAILDAVFYVLKSGCPWRLLPRDFPPWKTVYDWFRRWRIDGTWERLNALSCAGAYDDVWEGIRTLARASSIASRGRPRE